MKKRNRKGRQNKRANDAGAATMGRRRRRPRFRCAPTETDTDQDLSRAERGDTDRMSTGRDRNLTPAERNLFCGVAVTDPDAVDADAHWPADPDTMMRDYYAGQRWPAPGRRPTSNVSGEDALRCVHYAIIGGTASAQARALDKAVRLLGSRLPSPYVVIMGYLCDNDRDTPVGRAIVAHAPPSCLHRASVDSASPADRRQCTFPDGDIVRCLFLAYVADRCARAPTRFLTETLAPGAHRFFDMVVVYGDDACPASKSHRAAHRLVLLPHPVNATRTAEFADAVTEMDTDGIARRLLAQGRAAVRSWPYGTSAWDDMRVESPASHVPPRDQFHAHFAWRAHYVLARTGGPLLRSAQRNARGPCRVPSLLMQSARACTNYMDEVEVAVIPDECLDAIVRSAAAWLDLDGACGVSESDSAARIRTTVSATRRFLVRRGADHRLVSVLPTVDIVLAAL
ncbi:hypothetical protein psal_cds_328 [Pandoravirus salinus]|uniref:Uncharacterized protein n=1 Tax=Pandoravirus salinus TaxID=1349410 RepID=S4VUE5_9VIRU|nr:hypothetical protein psal_cds_328 [Pandoravirus salinus]AGO83958.1 hypothetical protein psal_cds_328 [Pandoravirus salinus]